MDSILLVEDDGSLIDGLVYALEREGYTVEVARTVQEFRQHYEDGKFSLLLLDVSLPDGTGFDICENVRKSSRIPVLFLTAADEELNVVRGLDLGGDDYVAKPFKLKELLSRIQALLRRAAYTKDVKGNTSENVTDSGGQAVLQDILCSGRLRVELTSHRAFAGEEPLILTTQEYRLLCMFLQNPGMVLTRQQILNRLWDDNGDFVDDNTLSVYIRRLRNKVEEEPSRPRHLITVRGIGYQWKA